MDRTKDGKRKRMLALGLFAALLLAGACEEIESGSEKLTMTPFAATQGPSVSVPPEPTGQGLTAMPQASAAPEATSTPSVTPTNAPAVTPTKVPGSVPTRAVTPTPTKAASPEPTKEASPTPGDGTEPTKAASPTPEDGAKPTKEAEASPTPGDETEPTKAATPMPEPTKEVSPEPTKEAEASPTPGDGTEPTKEATPTPGDSTEPTKEATPTPADSVELTPTPDPLPLVHAGWQNVLDITMDHYIVFPECFDNSAIAQEAPILTFLYTSNEDENIKFRIIYTIGETAEDAADKIYKRGGVIEGNLPEEKAFSYLIEEDGTVIQGWAAEEYYDGELLGEGYQNRKIVGTMRVEFVYPILLREQYETEEFRYYIVRTE